MEGAGVPVRYKRAAAPFGELTLARLCESSGSDHSPNDLVELEDLVDSFLERQEMREIEIGDNEEEEQEEKEKKKRSSRVDEETIKVLESLLGGADVEERIRATTEIASRSIELVPDSDGFKRQLMSELRQRGLDAGLCKSRWEKTSRYPTGSYEYIDVLNGPNRYVVEINLASEFEIARPTTQYLALLEVFPTVFIGHHSTMKQVVRLMSMAAKESIKSRDLHLPPWRRRQYMMEKWFGPYKRTTNLIPSSRALHHDDGISSKKQTIGFDHQIRISVLNCKGELVKKKGLKMGNLAAAFKGMQS